jgi:hypothetical protein
MDPHVCPFPHPQASTTPATGRGANKSEI